jgi:hypothetical protein
VNTKREKSLPPYRSPVDGRKESAKMKTKKRRYRASLPREMYLYFVSFDEQVGAPSFSKFARKIGVSLGELEAMREHVHFDEAYRECSEIRRDYLIDRALTKRFDPSLVKYLLESEAECLYGAEPFSVTLKVED